MNLTRFITYLEEHLQNLTLLHVKFFEFQTSQNLARGASKRWPDQQVRDVADKMYSGALITLYNNMSTSLGKNARFEQKWIEMLEKEDFLNNLDDQFALLDLSAE